jgi:hypothetical protein
VQRTILVSKYTNVFTISLKRYMIMFVKVVRLEVDQTLKMESEDSRGSDWSKSEA